MSIDTLMNEIPPVVLEIKWWDSQEKSKTFVLSGLSGPWIFQKKDCFSKKTNWMRFHKSEKADQEFGVRIPLGCFKEVQFHYQDKPPE